MTAAIDWSDRRARKALLAEIVADADRLLELSRQAQGELPEDSAERQGIMAAAELLGQLLLGGLTNVWVVIALVSALGSMLAFTITVRQTYTFDIVGSGLSLNGLALGAMAMQGGGIVGSLASGALIEVAGTGWQFVAAGVCYLCAAVPTLALSSPGRSARLPATSVLRNLTGYVSLVRSRRFLLALMFLTAATEVLGFTPYDPAAGVCQGGSSRRTDGDWAS